MNPPDAQEQLRFLTNLQRLLSEGQFVSTYKYALILALADISVEKGDDSGAPLGIDSKEISRKFIYYYWRQAVPYGGHDLLRQNSGRQAGIVSLIAATRRRHEGSLTLAESDTRGWNRLVSAVCRVVEGMPLWKLQTVGDGKLDFLYPNVGRGHFIELRPGVAFSFRRFRSLIGDLVHGAWLAYVRRFNREELGTTSDLQEFLFGSSRADLLLVRDILREVQGERCFYCQKPIRSQRAHVDHFIPWSRYQADLGHNFVLTDERCNGAKSDSLAAVGHLSRWLERNRLHGPAMGLLFQSAKVMHDQDTSLRIARWAYGTTASARGRTWVEGRRFAPLDGGWEHLFN